ncbi:BURP domain-containing protein 13 isoform X2 [Arachis duranensis]|uniref:BURP domain-containing protein 13 isoform X2 n=1 Tax=Arachis duranensis TaxID=130453 RepID=A0A6P5ND70_ARADU|nr:BURP domain-containing protein 13 isoform X2 [Arachis duranensis]
MATKLALCFLPFLLFFLMNGHGISSRDLKVELQDHTDTNSQSYITNYITPANTPKEENAQQYLFGYIATSDNTQSNYKTSKKHNHPSHSHHGNLNQPYITAYETSNAHDANKPNYLLGYRTSTHAPDTDILFWSTDKAYITQHGGDVGPKRDSNAPYIAQYGVGGSNKEIKKSATAQDSAKPDVTNYGLHSKKTYITKYGSDAGFKFTQYGDGIGPKRDSNAPYISQYGGDNSNKEIKTKSATTQNSAKPYMTTYGLHSKKTQGLKGGPPSSSVDHTEAFKVGFFAMDDLYIGNIMTLQFPVEEFSHFLSKKEADSIPFSIPQLPSVLQLFSISEDSSQAKSMRGTIEQCEAGTITGETKICANSLESMLEFVHNIIGSEEKHNIHTTTPSSGAPLQKYTILKISEDIYAPKWVACHPMPYPYGVYYCHFISTGTRVFKVLLDGENGDKVEALGVCHLDTSDWSPNHILFKQLGFMPGEAPVCHFFPVKHLMWVPQPSTVTM